MKSLDRRQLLYSQSIESLGEAIAMAQSGQFAPQWNNNSIAYIRDHLSQAIKSNALVEFNPRKLRKNEVAVYRADEYIDLISVVMLIFQELGRKMPDGKALLSEELGHLKPALLDPGLISYSLGIVFAPVEKDRIDVGGFMRPVGSLSIKTVVAMYRDAPYLSPSDSAMLRLFDELGL